MSMQRLSRKAINDIIGRVSDETAAAIVATGATEEQLMEARQWSIGDSSLSEEEGRPLEGVVAELYDILTADAAMRAEEDARRR
ncbi:MAG: hypothetical protein ACREB6_13960 [Rhodospirillales bacterium]